MSLNPVTPAFVETLRAALPEGVIREVPPSYLEEPRGRWAGQAGVVVAPASTEDVAKVIRMARAVAVPVIPYGGGTGLVGGQIMAKGPAPLLLSLERMRAIRGIYPEENAMVVEAGAILSDVHEATLDANRLYPLSIAAKGSARIGGLLSTNAGGVNVLRYGNARELCLGIEAVLPDGQIYHGLKRLRKDNAGYDLKDLLIGAEGTLGVITAATLRLFPRPAGEGTALMVVDSPQAALIAFVTGAGSCGRGVSAFELMHRAGLEFLPRRCPTFASPFAEMPEWFVLIDVGLARGDPAEALEALLW